MTPSRTGDARVETGLLDHPITPADMSPFPPGAGAESIFIGRTRAEIHPEHGRLQLLEYHAYEPMAGEILLRLAEEAVGKYEVRAVRLLHATGPVRVGEAGVLVQVAAPHREQSFAACRFLIDTLKEQCPIWKKEYYTSRTQWTGGVRAGEGAMAGVHPGERGT